MKDEAYPCCKHTLMRDCASLLISAGQQQMVAVSLYFSSPEASHLCLVPLLTAADCNWSASALRL